MSSRGAVECMACELISNPDRVPGGRIATLGNWAVEHCVGPLGLATAIVKPLRHVVHIADLDAAEASELGPVLAEVARAVSRASADLGHPPGQVYTCLWSHAGRVPGHVHFVIQPVDAALMARYDAHGPVLQVRMFEENEAMDPIAMANAAALIRRHLGDTNLQDEIQRP